MLDKLRSINLTWDKASRKFYKNIRASSSDERGRKLVVQILNNNQVEDLTGASLNLYWETKSKHHQGLDLFDVVDAEKGIFEIYFTTGMLSNIGVLNAHLHLLDGTGAITSELFKIRVSKGINTEAVESEDSFSTLVEALNRVVEIETQEQERIDNENSRKSAEASRKSAETNRVSAENTRESNESGRKSAEVQRNNNFNDKLTEWQNSYSQAESQRDTKYGQAEKSRDSKYESAENARNSLYTQAENKRNTQYSQSESTRDNKYNTAETSRDNTFTQSQIARKNEYEKEKSARESENSFRNIFNGTTRYFAHRGLSKYYPENSLKAFRKAAEELFYGIELDLRRTSDNKWVVSHDDTLSSMTNSSARISTSTFQSVTNTTITKGNGIEFTYGQEKIASFEEAIQVAREQDVYVQAEIKSSGTNGLSEVLDIVNKYNMINKVLFISFNFTQLEEIRKLEERAMLLHVSNSFSETLVNNASNLGRCGLSIKYTSVASNLEDALSKSHNKGVPIGCWTVNDLCKADELADLGFDFVTTDWIPGSRTVKAEKIYTFQKESGTIEFRLRNDNPIDSSDPYTLDDCTFENANTTEIRIWHNVPFISPKGIYGTEIRGAARAGVGGSNTEYTLIASSEKEDSLRVKFVKDGKLVKLDSLPSSGALWFNAHVMGYSRSSR